MATLTERIDLALKTRGWRYDSDNEHFMDGNRQLDLEALVELLPELTLDELEAYQDAKCDEERRQRAIK